MKTKESNLDIAAIMFVTMLHAELKCVAKNMGIKHSRNKSELVKDLTKAVKQGRIDFRIQGTIYRTNDDGSASPVFLKRMKTIKGK